MNYLNQNRNANRSFPKRIAVLANRWVHYIDENNLMAVTEIVLDIMLNVNDPTVK